jgi:hypothetical protein
MNVVERKKDEKIWMKLNNRPMQVWAVPSGYQYGSLFLNIDTLQTGYIDKVWKF